MLVWKRLVRCATIAVLGVALLDCVGSRGPFVQSGDSRIRHRELGYEIADLSQIDPRTWERFDVKGADLGYRTRGAAATRPSTMSLQSTCRPTLADASMLARHLRIGLRSPVLLQGGPVVVDGQAGWSQVFDTPERDGVARVKTITAVLGKCTFDWILVARGDFDEREGGFDEWWGSFRRNSSGPALGSGADAS